MRLQVIAMSRYIVKHTEKSSINKSPERIGGKASQLFNIKPDLVPYWSVITADCPDDKLQEVCWDIVNPNSTLRYAVRSSVVGEDGKDQSFAGIFESKLNVPITGIEHAVREVRETADTGRAEAYLKAHGYSYLKTKRYTITIPSPKVAVIVMPMVLARYSGVLFSKEPVGGTDQMLVEWEEGVGGVVDGESDSNMFFLEQENFRGYRDFSYPNALRVIWKEAKRLEKNYGKPVDIEWAINGEGKPYVLQVRPITAGVTV
jgi:phosphoenolpyruvate synthase/pyruvate phosphate dikinase